MRTVVVILWAAITAISMAVSLIALSQGSDHQTPTHSVENYHGNYWSTWHTRRNDQVLMVSSAVGLTNVILGSAAIILFF